MRINLSLDDKLLADVDAYCEKWRYDRSELMAKLLRAEVYGITNKSKSKVDLSASAQPIVYDKVEVKPLEPKTPPKDPNGDVLWEDSNFMPVVKKGVQGFCQGHFEQGVKHEVFTVSKETGSGVVVYQNKLLCRECVKKEVEGVKSLGGKLF